MNRSIIMDFGYCENAREYDHLTSFRKSLKRAGFNYEEVARESESRAAELYDGQVGVGDPVRFLAPCGDPDCLQCKEAYRQYRSSVWYARAMSACAVAGERRETPLFITLTFPNLVIDASKEDWKVMRQSLEERQKSKLLCQLKKRRVAGYFVTDFAYEDAVNKAIWDARHYAKDNLVGEMQKKYGRAVVQVDTGTGMTGIRLQSEHLKVINEHKRERKSPPYFTLLPSRDGEYSPRLGEYVKSLKWCLPAYPFVRWCFQKWVKRLRKGDNGFPAFKLKYLCFPEVGSSPRDLEDAPDDAVVDSDPDNRVGRLHYHMVIFLPVVDDIDKKSLRQSFKEACRYHWNAVTCSVRFPDSGQYGVAGSGNWFDVARDNGSVARYCAKYVAKDKLKGERVLASQGFNWSAAVQDESFVNRGLNAIKPDRDAWQKDYSYVSPYADREALPAEIGSSCWVGFDLTALSNKRLEVSDGSVQREKVGGQIAFRSDAQVPYLKVGAVFRCQSPVLHPASAPRGFVRTPETLEDMLSEYSENDLIHSLRAGTRQRLLESRQYDAVLKNLIWFDYSSVDRYLWECENQSLRRDGFVFRLYVDAADIYDKRLVDYFHLEGKGIYEVALPYGFIEGESGIAKFFNDRFVSPFLKWLRSDLASGMSLEKSIEYVLGIYKERVPSPSALRSEMQSLYPDVNILSPLELELKRLGVIQ